MDQWSLTPTEPRWHRTTRVLYTVAFVLVWLEAVSCFVYFQRLASVGSPVATAELTAGVMNHGHVFYVAARQKQLYGWLLAMMKFAIPGIMLAGLVLHHWVGVKILKDR